MSILTITESAKNYVHDKLQKQPQIAGLSLGIKKAGCSGFTYDLHFAEKLPRESSAFEQVLNIQGIKVVLKVEDLAYFKGTTIDCVKDDFGEYLQFNNPNVKGACGCGESFYLEQKSEVK